MVLTLKFPGEIKKNQAPDLGGRVRISAGKHHEHVWSAPGDLNV